ncbi:CRISPR-associated protein Cas4 [Candidatus Woesearchaeota archaeon]|nr:CRISPR-associated protein Cas4 [Candidatus Woesearchaeota archaeon]
MIPVSMLSSYMYCPRKVFMQNVLKLIEVPREAAVLGSIRHGAFDMINKAEQDIVVSLKQGYGLNMVEESYRKAMSDIVRNSIIVKKEDIRRARLEPAGVHASVMKKLRPEILIRARNVHDFMQKTGLLGEELWLELIPKIKSEYAVRSEPLQLSGVIDQILVTQERLVPVELKTGKAPREGLWPGHRIQLAAYVMLLEDRFNMNINEGILRYLDSDESRTLMMNPFIRQEVIDIRIKVENLLAALDIPAKLENDNRCGKCGLKEDCFNDGLISSKMKQVVSEKKETFK